MTKKILVLFTESTSSKHVDQSPYGFVESFEMEKYDTDIKLEYSFYNELVFTIIDGEASVVDMRTGIDIADYDFVYFRKWTSRAEEAVALATYLKKKQVPFSDEEVGRCTAGSKLTQMFMLWAADLPVPNTLYCRHGALKNQRLRNKEAFAYPFIMKKRVSHKGHDNFLVKDKDQFKEILSQYDSDSHLFIQNFIPNDYDFRVFTCGYKVGLLVKRSRQDPNTHLNNYSAGGKGELVPFDKVDPQLIIDAEKAARVFGREVAGSDVIINKEDGSHWFLEVNKSPQINTMVFGEDHTRVMRDYLIAQVKGEKA